jgi:hypothetical protein
MKRVKEALEADHVLGMPGQVHDALPAYGTDEGPAAIDVGEVRDLRVLSGA